MKTANISLNVQAVQSRGMEKSASVKDTSFENYFSKNAANTSEKAQPANVKTTGKKEISDGFDSHKVTVKADKNQTPVEKDMPTEEIAEKVTVLLQEVFGLSKEDVEDLLEQLGITPMDLVVDGTGVQQLLAAGNTSNINALILEAHGVEDSSAMLVSEELTSDWMQITQGISKILEQVADVPQDSPEMQKFLQNLTETITENKNIPEETQKQTDVETDPAADASAVNASQEESIPVTVEVSDESGQSGAFAQDSQSGSRPAAEAENSLPAFVDRLTQAFEPGTENAEIRQVSMQEIVDQVVNHIRIRVLPQTTSMELQLNPESLGRVHLSVSSNQGVATATLTVQNEMAKEALESQLVVLRENLESQGLKVESVEVNVSNFGFKNQEDSNNHNFDQKKGSAKRFRVDAGEQALDGDNVSQETETERQDGESIVDYTA
ncbi:flagellar hook-length control protein [Roseburia sp. CAG:309]|nr:flagellar hook-length control protein [Roseburia sp. CAG:309]